MSTGNIRFSTDILRRLGEELNPSIDQGVLELVKNAYDADARTCIVQITNVDSGNLAISVRDDGNGMEQDDIISGWLVLGASRKKTNNKTPLGRVPAGNKGLGRLAALRLGDTASMTTVSRKARTKTSVVLDWDEFDRADLVEDVQVQILSEPIDEPSGTEIIISGLRKKIGRMEVKRLARSMILLADPFGVDMSGFAPVLQAPEFADLERLVSGRYFTDAEYCLTARLVGGRASAEIRDWRGQTLWNAKHEDLSARSVDYAGPDAEFDLWAYSLNNKNFSTRATSLSEVREWLSAFGGVHLYSNGLRVSPYGNSGNDWLDLNLSRVRSPEERPSTNNSIGRVLVHDETGILTQKTDRSGIIESGEFDEIRRFATDALEWMARRRLAAAESRRQKQRQETAEHVQTSTAEVQEEIRKLPQQDRKQIESAFAHYAADRDRREDALHREVQLYRTLSTAGITTAVFAHESNGGGLKVIGQAVNAIERRTQDLLPDQYVSRFEGPIRSIRRAAETLGVLSATTLRLVDQDKRRIGRVDLHQVIREVISVFDPFFRGRHVEVETSLCDGVPYLYGSEAAIESILTNLINNSLGALEAGIEAPRKLQISTTATGSEWTLSVSDNGPGILDISLSEIWLPGQTRRHGGTGLGLTIVKDAVSDLNGKARAVAKGDLGGATFHIELPILGVEDDI
jgi:signal transduction histidine kinase